MKPRKNQIWQHSSVTAGADNRWLIVKQRAGNVWYVNASRKSEAPTKMSVSQFTSDFTLIPK